MILKVRRKLDGNYAVTLDPRSAQALQDLPRKLRNVLDRPDVSCRVTARLFPRAYKDAAEEAEYRRLLGDELLRRKRESIKVFEATFRNTKLLRVRGEDVLELTVKPEEYELWLGFVNNMRIVIGTELDIQEDGWDEHFDPQHPKANDFGLLHYLSWLEDELLKAHPKLP